MPSVADACSHRLMLEGLQQVCVDVITGGLATAGLALGFLIVLRGTGVFNVAFGALFVAAGYAFAALYPALGMSTVLAAPLTAILAAAAMGLLDAGFNWVGGEERHGGGSRALVASIGLAIIVENACAWAFGTDVRLVSAAPVAAGHTVLPWAFALGMAGVAAAVYTFARSGSGSHAAGLVTLVATCGLAAAALHSGRPGVLPRGRMAVSITALACLLAVGLFARTARGTRWRAYLSSPAAARLLGYRASAYRLASAVVGGAVLGLISSAHVANSGVRPDESWRLLIGAAFVALLAGRVSPVLLVLSGVAYALASYLAVLAFSSAWRDAFAFAMLFALLILKSRRFDAETAPAEV